MMRWWWFGPEVSRADIERDLTTMAQAGIGGVEVAYVYPLAEQPTRLGSAEFLADLAYAADAAERLGLRFDVTLGSGWSFGGPHIGPEHAAKRLRWDSREIGPGALTLSGGQQVWPGDELVGVYLGAGSIQEWPETYRPLPIRADGSVDIPAGTGTRVVLTATAGLTGQNVKRAAAGAEGPVHDHYDPDAAVTHLAALGDRLVAAVGAERIGTVFCDSLEVYEADWTPRLRDEFAVRRGYRLEPELHLLVTEGPDSARFRADYYRTLSELYEENFLGPLADWAHGHGLLLRVQSYGEPPATLSSYARVDAIEGEQWGWTTMPPTKWASSAAHHLGVPVVSSETWTWVHAPSFRATPLDLKGEAHEHFLLGINQLIGHGWPCSPRPDETQPEQGLGWFFYASGALDDRNAWWPAAPDLMRYLTKLSWLLRQGEPVRDVLVYLPTTDAYARLGTATSLDLYKTLAGLVDPALTGSLRTGGYDFALIDDDATSWVEPQPELVVLLPGAVTVPARTQDWLDRVVAAGGRVTAVGPDDDAATLVGRTVTPDLALRPREPTSGWCIVGSARSMLYLLVNTGPHVRTQRVVPRTRRAVVEVWDAADGTTVATGGADSSGTEITLVPYQALVLRRPRPGPAAVHDPRAGSVSDDGGLGRRLAAGGRRRHRPGTGRPPPPLGGRRADRPRLLRHGQLRHHPADPPRTPAEPARSRRRRADPGRRRRPGERPRGPLVPGRTRPAGRRGRPGRGRRRAGRRAVGAAVRMRPDRAAEGQDSRHAAPGGVQHDRQRAGCGCDRGRLGGRCRALARSAVPDAGVGSRPRGTELGPADRTGAAVPETEEDSARVLAPTR